MTADDQLFADVAECLRAGLQRFRDYEAHHGSRITGAERAREEVHAQVSKVTVMKTYDEFMEEAEQVRLTLASLANAKQVAEFKVGTNREMSDLFVRHLAVIEKRLKGVR